MKKTKIMIVEDEMVVADDIRNCLVMSGYAEPASVSSGEEAVEALAEVAPGLILMDIRLAGRLDGIETARRIAELADIPVVFLTAFSDTDILERVKTAEPFGYIVKPFDRNELRCVIETALVKHERMKEKLLALGQQHRLLLERGQPHGDPDSLRTMEEDRPWPLKIHTLGRFELINDGKPMRFTGKVQQKPLALLKALIAFGGKDVAEEQITDLLWPDADGDLAHKSFEMTVQRLRRLINNDKVIQLQERRLSLDKSLCGIDVWELEDLIERVDALWKSGPPVHDVPEEAVRLSERAITLYKGHFLPADSAHAWVLSFRERLRSKFLRLILKLGAFRKLNLQWEQAAEVFQKGIEVDGLAEEFYQHLMMCYQQLGRRAEAIAVFNRCRTLMISSIGIPPSRKTEELYQSIIKKKS